MYHASVREDPPKTKWQTNFDLIAKWLAVCLVSIYATGFLVTSIHYAPSDSPTSALLNLE